MEWYEVKKFNDCSVEYVYDEVVNELMKNLSEIEEVAVGRKDYSQLELIRKQKMNIMATAIPKVVIRHNN